MVHEMQHNLNNHHDLETLANWLAQAADWLGHGIAESRERRPANLNEPPEQRIERVAFITAELDTMLAGIQRASLALRTVASGSDRARQQRRPPMARPGYLQVVK